MSLNYYNHFFTDVVSPNAFVTNEDTGDISTTYLQLTRVNGDVAPSVLCVSSSTLITALIWVKEETDNLPIGVTETNLFPQTGQAVKLDWRRKMRFTDTGTYTCKVTNRDGSTIVGIELLVRCKFFSINEILNYYNTYFTDPPIITSIFPTYPVVSAVEYKIYSVPEGYSGVVITCTAVGWPPPTLSWLSNFKQDLLQTKFSHDIDSEDFGYHSTSLQFIEGVNRVHAGDYICYVSGRDTNITESVVITLEVTSDEIPNEAWVRCPIKLATVFFQLQVLDTSECLNWELNKIEKIAEITRDVLIGGIISQCDECATFSDSVSISYGPLCSETLTDATVFRGEITTTDAITTSKAICGLTAWYQSRPLIRINDEFKLLDQDCALVVKSLLGSSSCTGNIVNLSQIITYGSSFAVVLIFVIALVLIVSVLATIRKK